MALISLEHVSKIYPKGTRPALDKIDLSINRGDFVFLVGASGSGKTTLLSLLLREEEATGGEIHVAGNDLRRLSNRQVPQYRRSIGFVFQDYKLLNNKTVWQNVAFALEVIGTRRSTIRSLVPKVLQTVGLTGKENSYPHELSGGEAQRVAIARAYVNHPQILLADEPTGNLDPTTSLGIMEVLDAINRTGTTIVMATHNEEIVNSMRKRVVELHAGHIVRDEREGSYDSALYFPDAEVESKSHQAIGSGAASASGSGAKSRALADSASSGYPISGSASGAAADSTSGSPQSKQKRGRDVAGALDAVNAAIESGAENEGIARLANSVHSGRTGRYGEAFTQVETTLTWGRGLSLEEYARRKESESKAGGAGSAQAGSNKAGSAQAGSSKAEPSQSESDASHAVESNPSGQHHRHPDERRRDSRHATAAGGHEPKQKEKTTAASMPPAPPTQPAPPTPPSPPVSSTPSAQSAKLQPPAPPTQPRQRGEQRGHAHGAQAHAVGINDSSHAHVGNASGSGTAAHSSGDGRKGQETSR